MQPDSRVDTRDNKRSYKNSLSSSWCTTLTNILKMLIQCWNSLKWLWFSHFWLKNKSKRTNELLIGTNSRDYAFQVRQGYKTSMCQSIFIFARVLWDDSLLKPKWTYWQMRWETNEKERARERIQRPISQQGGQGANYEAWIWPI